MTPSPNLRTVLCVLARQWRRVREASSTKYIAYSAISMLYPMNLTGEYYSPTTCAP